jgi:hypothetical protein
LGFILGDFLTNSSGHPVFRALQNSAKPPSPLEVAFSENSLLKFNYSSNKNQYDYMCYICMSTAVNIIFFSKYNNYILFFLGRRVLVYQDTLSWLISENRCHGTMVIETASGPRDRGFESTISSKFNRRPLEILNRYFEISVMCIKYYSICKIILKFEAGLLPRTCMHNKQNICFITSICPSDPSVTDRSIIEQ